MGTIRERADRLAANILKDADPANSPLLAELIAESYCIGANEEHLLLTKWHDPTEELPEDGHLVLLKTTFGKGYQLAEHEGTGWWRPYDDEWEISDNQVVGWREIQE